MLNIEKTNLLEKIRFLEFEHHSLLKKNNALTLEIKSNKPSSPVNENFHTRTKVLDEILYKCKKYVWTLHFGSMRFPLDGEARFYI